MFAEVGVSAPVLSLVFVVKPGLGSVQATYYSLTLTGR